MVGIRRREVIKAFGGAALAWPVGARAQGSAGSKRVGVLMGSSNDYGKSLLAAFVESLQQLGWTSGGNLELDVRWAGGEGAAFSKYAQELIELKPNAILANSNSAVTAFQQSTKTIPIVFTQVSDPIGRGFAATLARPGGNITGFSSFETTMGGKWLEKLKEIAPKITRAALLFNPLTTPHIANGFYLRAAEDAGRRTEVRTFVTPVHDTTELEASVGQFATDTNSGLIILPDGFTLAHVDLTITLAARFRLPAIYAFRSFAARGGLASYAIVEKDQYASAALYVDRILRGALPAELPIQFSSKFELVINLKTAKALGLDVPTQLLQIADDLIE